MLKENFSFTLEKENNLSRVGKINTQRGTINTPSFMTVGTQATVKAVFPEDVVWLLKVLYPTAVLKLPSVIASPANPPIKVLLIPVVMS